MFDDKTQTTNDPGVTPEPAPGGVLGPATDNPPVGATITPSAPAAASASISEDKSADTFNSTPLSMANEPVVTPPAADSTLQASTPSTPAGSDDLLSLKQQALQSLNPLLGHLDQSPEEKFKTTMMMIQASDDQSLIKMAYETAQQITDEKEKAQALLDVVNEINYFTQQAKG